MSAFHAIVQQRRGGYCFVCNSLFSALLRHLGFTVSEVGARVNGARNTAASDNGYQWTGISHMALLVDVEDDRFLCDVGFGGGGSEHPVKLRDASQMRSVTASESFELRNETLPGADPVAFRDLPKGAPLSHPQRLPILSSDRLDSI
jgi:arylamine N-acetyltransferase